MYGCFCFGATTCLIATRLSYFPHFYHNKILMCSPLSAFVAMSKSSNLKALKNQTFLNMLLNNWYILPVGQWELIVTMDAATANSKRRQKKKMGDIICMKSVPSSSKNPTAYIKLQTANRGWIHVDPALYDSKANGDVKVKKHMSIKLGKEYSMNKKIGKCCNLFDLYKFV